jgi:hypothetical protein
MSYFKIISQYLLGGNKDDHKKPLSVQSVSWPRYEPGTSRIWRSSVNHSDTTFVSPSTIRIVDVGGARDLTGIKKE